MKTAYMIGGDFMWEAIAEGDKQGVLVLRTPEKRDMNIPIRMPCLCNILLRFLISTYLRLPKVGVTLFGTEMEPTT